MKIVALVAVLVAALLISDASGFAVYRSNIPNGMHVEHPCDTTKVWAGVGHRSDQGGNERNQFGLDFKAAGYTWTRSLCLKDSDGDGESNGEELGDPQCVWRRGDAAAARSTNITHPGFKTPVGAYPYSKDDSATLNCKLFFQRCAAFDEPGIRYIDLRAANGSQNSIVPGQETTYFNMNYELPSDQQYHAVGFAPILDNLNVIHHFVMTGCQFPVPTGKGYESFNVQEGCERTMYAWSFGLGDECMPEDAGVPFGGKHPSFVQLQLHWTNRQKYTGYRDTSGVRIYYTSKLRKYNMGSLTLGQLQLTIPPGQASVNAPSTCTSDCTKALLDQGPIQVTAAFPHMHFLGKSLSVDLVKANGTRSRILDDKVYNYNSPTTYEYGPNYVLLEAGDVLHSNCEFSSTSRNETTRWGFSSYSEMCFTFIRYFPLRGELSCLQYDSKDFCYAGSHVDGPRCSVFRYFENITVTVDTALRECGSVIAEVQKDNPVTKPVCTPQCLSQVGRVLEAHRSPCQQTRHKEEWKLLNSLISDKLSTLQSAETHCRDIGIVDQQLEGDGGSGSGSAMLSVNSLLMLTVSAFGLASGLSTSM